MPAPTAVTLIITALIVTALFVWLLAHAIRAERRDAAQRRAAFDALKKAFAALPAPPPHPTAKDPA